MAHKEEHNPHGPNLWTGGHETPELFHALPSRERETMKNNAPASQTAQEKQGVSGSKCYTTLKPMALHILFGMGNTSEHRWYHERSLSSLAYGGCMYVCMYCVLCLPACHSLPCLRRGPFPSAASWFPQSSSCPLSPPRPWRILLITPP